MDGVMGHVMNGVCDGRRLSQRLSQAEGVTEVWLFWKDSFEECPLTPMYVQLSEVLSSLQLINEFRDEQERVLIFDGDCI